MKVTLGKYKVVWSYDPLKHTTYCAIFDQDGIRLVKTQAVLYYKDNYNKVEARTVTFKKAINEVVKKDLLSQQELQEVKFDFRKFITSDRAFI